MASRRTDDFRREPAPFTIFEDKAMTTAVFSASFRSIGAALLVVWFSASSVWADSIVLRNRSGAGGNIVISNGVETFAQADFRSPPAPTAGDFTFGDMATASAGGASGTVAADIATSITPSRFLAHGNLSTVTSRRDPVLAGASGNSVSQIDFLLLEPHAFTYSGQFLIDREGSVPEVTPILFAGLNLISSPTSQPVIFFDTLANFSGLLVPPGSHTIEHAGIIGPGSYVLSAALASVFQGTSTAFPSTRSQIAFDVAFTLDPVSAPTPEPTTVALLGIGIAGMIGRQRTRPKGRTGGEEAQ
jgi:hypothetical protein